MYVYTYIYIYVCMYVYIYICMYIYISMYNTYANYFYLNCPQRLQVAWCSFQLNSHHFVG